MVVSKESLVTAGVAVERVMVQTVSLFQNRPPVSLLGLGGFGAATSRPIRIRSLDTFSTAATSPGSLSSSAGTAAAPRWLVAPFNSDVLWSFRFNNPSAVRAFEAGVEPRYVGRGAQCRAGCVENPRGMGAHATPLVWLTPPHGSQVSTSEAMAQGCVTGTAVCVNASPGWQCEVSTRSPRCLRVPHHVPCSFCPVGAEAAPKRPHLHTIAGAAAAVEETSPPCQVTSPAVLLEGRCLCRRPCIAMRHSVSATRGPSTTWLSRASAKL